MIKIKTTDFNLKEILDQSGLNDLDTGDNEYYIFGLKDKGDKFCVELTYHYQTHMTFHSFWSLIAYFLQRNGISTKTYSGSNYDAPVKDYPIIKIGLRRDLREHIPLSAAILNTIIYANEGKLREKDFNCHKNLTNVPKFR